MKIENLKVSELVPYEKNPRRNDTAVDSVAESIKQFGFQQPIVVDKNNVIVVGHTRYKSAQKLGLQTVPCVRADQLTKEQVKAYRILDNKLNELATWDLDALAEELNSFDFDFSGFDVDFSDFPDFLSAQSYENEFSEGGGTSSLGSLSELFIVPPFSVLDSRSVNWAKRKKIWNRLLQSGEGRKDGLLGWSDTIAKKVPNMAGTSIFDPVLCETLYHWFCPPSGKIIDPFAGGSVRGMVASFLEREYTGVDISRTQIETNENCFAKLQKLETLQGNELKKPNWICADAKDILSVAHAKAPYDFLISCPPYFDLEQYSDDENDLSNLSWSEFQTAYRQIFKDAIRMLNNDSFAAVVIGEVRDKKDKNGQYLNLVGETITALTEAGTEYYNEMVLVTSFASAALRARRQFVASRKVVKVHQNVLVFVKGDAKKAASKMGNDVDWFKDVDEDEDNS
jgi:hypothetical protein